MAEPRHDTTDPRITRRRFLKATVAGGVAAFLAACGANNSSGNASPGTSGVVSTPPSPGASATGGPGGSAAAGSIGGELNFANKIGYIDLSEDGSAYPMLDAFKQATGVTVHYDESIEDDEEFFSSDLQGPLSESIPPPWDLVVLSDWMVARLARLGWLEPMDPAATPSFQANLLAHYRKRSFDQDTKFAAPWLSGMTGIGFDRKKTGDIRSLSALWDPKYKARVATLDAMRDAVGLAAIKLGIDPETITKAEFDRALAELQKAHGAGLGGGGDSYVDAMAAGDVVIAMAYSGDVLTLLQPSQEANQDFQFVVPTEGGMLWSDNLCIPKGARNKKQAQALIDFYYQPAIAAQVEAYVKYVSPVKGVAEILRNKSPEVANNPLAFPPADVLARLHQFRTLNAAEETEWDAAFDKVGA
jgi:spermidine/putrescine transport system substrate-binding protein